MTIGFDLDEVIAEFLSSFLEFHNNKYDTALKIDYFHSYNFEEVCGGTKEDAINKVYEFFDTEHFKNIRPTIGSVEAIKILNQRGHRLIVVTARQNEVVEKTKEWLEKHFPNMFREVHFTNRHGRIGEKPKKSEICKRLGIEVIIEDNLEYAIDCAQNGVDVLLLDKPWNQGDLPKNIKRVSSWDEIFKEISPR